MGYEERGRLLEEKAKIIIEIEGEEQKISVMGAATPATLAKALGTTLGYIVPDMKDTVIRAIHAAFAVAFIETVNMRKGMRL